MPRAWLYVALADRFKVPPWTVRAVPIADVQETLGLLNVEAHVADDWAGMGPDDDLIRQPEDDEDW